MRSLGDPGKSQLAFGLTLYVLFVFALATRLGIVPSVCEPNRQARRSLCEVIAISSVAMWSQNDLVQLEDLLVEIVQRDAALASAAIRLADDYLLIEAGSHQAAWQKPDGAYSTDTQVQVPLGSEDEPCGTLELRFHPAPRPDKLRTPVPAQVQLLAFVAVACYVGFRSFLGQTRVSAPQVDSVSARQAPPAAAGRA